MNEIKLYKSPWKGIRLLLLCLPFLAAALYNLLSSRHFLPAWLSYTFIVCFGTGVITALVLISDRRPQVIINETGIFDRTAYDHFINWNIIDHAYWNLTHGTPYVCLIIKDEFKHLIKRKLLTNLSVAMGYEEININLGSIPHVDHEKLTGLIVNLAKAKPTDRSRLIGALKLNSSQ